ncbi:hypothetical protein B0H19DRAFT_230971 [Mycena capillaripes]|nr:hypothetical protein B0H19DRAFT_230971 [Mycena capillaripes]
MFTTTPPQAQLQLQTGRSGISVLSVHYICLSTVTERKSPHGNHRIWVENPWALNSADPGSISIRFSFPPISRKGPDHCVKRSRSTSQAKLEDLKLGPSQAQSQSTSPPTSSESFMTARTSATPTLGASAIASRLSGTPSPRTPTSPSPNPASFIQEIDVFMDNIGRLVRALEDKHSQRRFDIARSSLNGGNAGKDIDSRHNTSDLAPSKDGMSAEGSAGVQSPTK